MTLTDMIKEFQGKPDSSQEAEASEWELQQIKDVLKVWLKTIALPDHWIVGVREPLNATESTRKLLIALVDEP